jgi:hypothetical protein
MGKTMVDQKLEIRGNMVILRKTSEGDFPNLITLWNDGRVMKWVGFPNGLGYDLKKKRKRR